MKKTKKVNKSAVNAKSNGNTAVKAKTNGNIVKSTGNVSKSKSKENVNSAGIKKNYLKIKNLCRVTFTLPRLATLDANKVCLVGEFNNWSGNANKMKMLKNGDFTTTIDLKPGREYQFRYLINEAKWENDWNADKYISNPFHSNNSVVVL